jgi:hypothetical protein
VDIGSPGRAGSAFYDSVSRSWTVSGGGADIWNAADQFHFASQSFTSDGSITAQVTSVQNTDPWAKAGVMFRDSTAAGAPFADVVATPGNGVAFQWRSTAGTTPDNVNISGLSAPVWVQIDRSGDEFTAFYSSDGVTWTQIGDTQTIAMNATALAGLAVTAHNNATLNTATFTNVSLLPAGWVDADVGSPSWPGYAYDNTGSGEWTVAGGGAGIGGTADQFHFASQGFSGDGSMTARVTGVMNTDPGAEAGVMFRGSTDPSAPFADVVVTPGNGVAFQWRGTPGDVANSDAVIGPSTPIWVQLVRSGNDFSAFYSSDGVTWTQIGDTQTIAMNPTALAGLAVTAGNATALSVATFTDVSLAAPGDVLPAYNQVPFVGTGVTFSGYGQGASNNSFSFPAAPGRCDGTSGSSPAAPYFVALRSGRTAPTIEPGAWSNDLALSLPTVIDLDPRGYFPRGGLRGRVADPWLTA